jgi:ABC-type lipoprotein export system ATPase subunit
MVDADDDNVLSASGISFSYGRKKHAQRGENVVGPLSIALHQGEITAPIGSSGCGKSTTLKLLAGILRPNSGKIDYGGRDITTMAEVSRAKLRRTKFAFVFQDYMLIDSLTVGENISLPIKLNKKSTSRDAVLRALDFVNLDDRLINVNVAELSGGQQQRVAIARTLLMDADVLFADEPTGNLDPKAREDTLDAIETAMNGGLKTCLLVTHDPEVAARADRVLYMENGRIEREFPAMTAKQVERILLNKDIQHKEEKG